VYTGGPKSKPLPNDQKIVLNRIKMLVTSMRLDLFVKLKYKSSSIGIRYSMCDILSDHSNYV